MQVHFNKNMTFTARNPHIRFADDIARCVNRNYPRLSSTLYEGMGRSASYNKNIENLMGKIQTMREELFFSLLEHHGDFIKKCRILSDIIKSKKVGNCHESAILAEIVAKTNGIRNCFTAQLKPTTGNFKDTHDHAVLYVDSPLHPYIIDPWLGFADFVPNAIERYKKEYSKHFDFKKFGTDEMFFDILQNRTPIDSDTEKELKRIFPDLILK